VAVRSKPVRPPTPAPRRRVGPAVPSRVRRGSDARHATAASRQPGAPHPAPPPVVRSPAAGSLSGGDVLLLVFFAATVIMVIAVVLVGAAAESWVLVPVMLVDFAVTFAVIATLVQLLGHDD
jgi:hypothetical protein